MKKILITIVGILLFSFAASAQHASAGVNAADLVYYGTLNVEASVAAGRHFSVTAKGRYNPWEFGTSSVETELHRKQRSAEVGVRYWPWHVYSGWWIGTQARWQEYNRNGMFISREDLTEEGDAFGGGLSGGYTLMLYPWLNVEFGFGMWAGKTYYKTYDCPTCGRPVSEGEKFFILPNEALLSLVYIF